jgi:16S rRNA (cytidine1402-2'-O)-methyltransferase
LTTLKAGIYIVPTPIGNLDDITLRALKVLENSDEIFCEDTRVSQKLLTHFSIKKRLYIYNDHSTEKDRNFIIEKAREKAISLISDAGMPLISDPGYKLVRQAHADKVYITALPGACALVNAVVLSSFPTDKFSFLGFFSEKYALEYKNLPHTLIFYLSPHQLKKTLDWVNLHFSNRQVALCKEISKLHETVVVAESDIIYEALLKQSLPKGEFVLVLSPPAQENLTEADVLQHLIKVLKTQNSKDAILAVAKELNIPKKRVYELYLNNKNI